MTKTEVKTLLRLQLESELRSANSLPPPFWRLWDTANSYVVFFRNNDDPNKIFIVYAGVDDSTPISPEFVAAGIKTKPYDYAMVDIEQARQLWHCLTDPEAGVNWSPREGQIDTYASLMSHLEILRSTGQDIATVARTAQRWLHDLISSSRSATDAGRVNQLLQVALGLYSPPRRSTRTMFVPTPPTP